LKRRGLNSKPDMVGENFKSFHLTDPDGWTCKSPIKRRAAAAGAGREAVVDPTPANVAGQAVTPVRSRDASWRLTQCRPSPVLSLYAR
jgi:hypothetical protein